MATTKKKLAAHRALHKIQRTLAGVLLAAVVIFYAIWHLSNVGLFFIKLF